MSHFGRSGPPDIKDTFSLLVLNITFSKLHPPSLSPLLPLPLTSADLAGTSADDLFPLFDKYGKVVDIFIPRDRRTGDSRGFAFVRYKYPDEAQKAVEKLDGRTVDGREILVQFAKYGPNAERIQKGRIVETHEKSKGGRSRSRSPKPRRRDDYRGRDNRRRSRSRSRERSDRDKYRRRSRSNSRSPDYRGRGRGRADDERRKSRSRSFDSGSPARRSPSPRKSPPPRKTTPRDGSTDKRDNVDRSASPSVSPRGRGGRSADKRGKGGESPSRSVSPLAHRGDSRSPSHNSLDQD